MHIDKNDLIKFDNETMNTQEIRSPVTAPSYLTEQILNKAASSEVPFSRAANKVSQKVQFLRYSLQTAAGVAAALLLLFGIPNVDFSELKADHSSVRTERTVSERSGSQLYNFSKTVNRNICNSSSSLAQHISGFSSKIMNGGK